MASESKSQNENCERRHTSRWIFFVCFWHHKAGSCIYANAVANASSHTVIFSKWCNLPTIVTKPADVHVLLFYIEERMRKTERREDGVGRERARHREESLQIHKGFVMNARCNNKNKNIKGRKDMFLCYTISAAALWGIWAHKSAAGILPDVNTKSTSLQLSLKKKPETHYTPVSSASAARSVPMLSSPASLMRFVLFILPFCSFYLSTTNCLYPCSIPHGLWLASLMPASEVWEGVYRGLFGKAEVIMQDTMLSLLAC